MAANLKQKYVESRNFGCFGLDVLTCFTQAHVIVIILFTFKFNKFLNLYNPHVATLIEAGCITYNKIHYITNTLHHVTNRFQPNGVEKDAVAALKVCERRDIDSALISCLLIKNKFFRTLLNSP